MGTRITCTGGWLYNVDETPDEVQTILADGQPHVLVPWVTYKGGHEVEPEPVVITITDVRMLADSSV